MDINEIIELYYGDGLTLEEVGSELGCSASVVSAVMEDNGVKRRPHGVSYENLDSKPDPRFYISNGYVQVQCTTDVRQNDSFLLHRLTAVAWYGWDEVVGRDIHHKNSIGWDNREENIEPIDREEHMLIHLAGQ